MHESWRNVATVNSAEPLYCSHGPFHDCTAGAEATLAQIDVSIDKTRLNGTCTQGTGQKPWVKNKIQFFQWSPFPAHSKQYAGLALASDGTWAPPRARP